MQRIIKELENIGDSIFHMAKVLTGKIRQKHGSPKNIGIT